jgi:hypothetical protein
MGHFSNSNFSFFKWQNFLAKFLRLDYHSKCFKSTLASWHSGHRDQKIVGSNPAGVLGFLGVCTYMTMLLILNSYVNALSLCVCIWTKKIYIKFFKRYLRKLRPERNRLRYSQKRTTILSMVPTMASRLLAVASSMTSPSSPVDLCWISHSKTAFSLVRSPESRSK